MMTNYCRCHGGAPMVTLLPPPSRLPPIADRRSSPCCCHRLAGPHAHRELKSQYPSWDSDRLACCYADVVVGSHWYCRRRPQAHGSHHNDVEHWQACRPSCARVSLACRRGAALLPQHAPASLPVQGGGHRWHHHCRYPSRLCPGRPHDSPTPSHRQFCQRFAQTGIHWLRSWRPRRRYQGRRRCDALPILLST
jgi:hypothetical protein